MMKRSVAMIALLGCGGASTPASTPQSESTTEPSTVYSLQPQPEIVLDDEHIELNLARSVARQQALEQARATGVKKEAEPEPLPDAPPGPRTKESVRAAFVEARMNGIKRCYEAALYADQSAQGSVVITFEIIDNGNVAKPTATGFTEAIHSCLVAEVLKTRFPTGGLTPVKWSLQFTST